MTSGQREILRFAANGVAATLVQYTVLSVNMTVLKFHSAGLANFVAALFGISASFLGSYYFVFSGKQGRMIYQLAKFGGLYGLFAVLHGSVLWLWSDHLGLDYRIGFLAATGLQVSFTYFGNKHFVFR